jgi:hypothetical protein
MYLLMANDRFGKYFDHVASCHVTDFFHDIVEKETDFFDEERSTEGGSIDEGWSSEGGSTEWVSSTLALVKENEAPLWDL